ncbi:MAG: AMP-binding protein, partial [Acidobacteria bacterium]|nr:AMP-binding protein [Acidobacteriota bacterium]
EAMDWRGLTPGMQAASWTSWLEADRARGFEPEKPPLMRAALAQLSDEDWYFCWSHHHLLLDGWCLSLVLEELFARYDALEHGGTPALAPVRPYSDYIAWLRGRDRAALDAYWRDTLRGFTTPTALLSSGARETGASPRAVHAAPEHSVAEVRLSSEQSSAIRAAAATHRLTLNTLVQGAWAIVLSRYSGTTDVVFGTTVSGRPSELPGVETMLGVFINTVPVRLDVDEGAPAAAWLADIQARHVEREAFATIPLTDIQKLSDVEAGTPLFDTNVIVMNYRLDERLASGAGAFAISDLRIVDQTDIPLTLQVTPGERMAVELLYDTARFERGAVERMLGHVAHVLAQFADDLTRTVGAIAIVTPAERARLFDVFNATAAPLDARETVLDVWDARVAETPDAVALECDNTRLTYRELNAWAERLATGLRALAPAPLAADTLVAIAFRRSERLVAAILAIWKCGAAYVPVDPDYPEERIRQVIESAAPRIVLRDDGTLDGSLETVFGPSVRFAAVGDVERAGAEAGSRDVPRSRRAEGRDLAYVIFTSGSTGLPKGAMVEHTGMLNHLLAKVEDFALDRASLLVQNASHCFDISVWQCFAALLAGGRTLVYIDALVLDPERFLARVRSDRVTVLEVVPSYLGALLDRAGSAPPLFEDLRLLVVTGETVKPALVARWFALFPAIPMANAYGPTEASDDITHAFMRSAPLTPTVPVGRPLRNFHIYVVDDRMRLCPIGVAGEVCVSGPGVGRGYLNDPGRTAAAFLDDPFRA